MLPFGGGLRNPQKPDYNADVNTTIQSVDEIGFFESLTKSWKKITFSNFITALGSLFYLATTTLNNITAPSGDVSLNSHKITNMTNGASASDAAAFGQIPTSFVGDLDPLLYGNGSDGALHYDGSTTILGVVPAGGVYTLTRTIYGTTILIDNGATVIPDGNGMFFTVSLTNNGIIHRNGNKGTGTTGGASLGMVGSHNGRYGQAGIALNSGAGSGANANSDGVSKAGGSGGAGGSTTTGIIGGNGGTAGLHAGIGALSSVRVLDLIQGYLTQYLSLTTVQQIIWGGGCGGGGGGGSNSGGGGSGAGQVCLFGKSIINGVTGVIEALGGNGANGTGSAGTGGGGGGAGGGGLIVMVYHTLTNLGTISVAGGSPGVNYGWRHNPINLVSVNLSTSATTYATGSATPVSGQLYLVAVHNQKGSATDTPTLAGTNGFNVTWTQVKTQGYNTTSTTLGRLTVFRGVASSAVVGTITASFGGNTQTGCQIMVVGVPNVDQTTNQGVVQSAVTGNAASSSSVSGTLSAFGNVKHFTLGFVVDKTTTANVTAPTNWTELAQLNVSTTGSLECAYINYEADSGTWTITSGVNANLICELAGNDTDDGVAGSTGTIVSYQV